MLALDISSTSIGYVNARSYGYIDAYGTEHLTRPDVYQRIDEAHSVVCDLIDTYTPRVIVIERNSGTNASGLIACARVTGSIIHAAVLRQLPVVEVSAKTGKKVLADNGNATKEMMVCAAVKHFGFTAGTLGRRRVVGVDKHGKRKYTYSVAWIKHDGTVAYDEHASDALGLLLAYQAEQDARLREAA